MKKVNIFERLYRSVIDFSFSNHFIQEKMSKSIGLLFFGYLLFTVCLITFLVMSVSPFLDSMDEGSIGFIDEIPDFQIMDGEFSFSNDTVYYEKDFDGSTMYFDLENRNPDSYYLDNDNENMLVRKDGLYQNGMMILGFSTFRTVVDKSLMYNIVDMIKPLMVVALVFIAVFGIVGLFILSALVWALAIIINGFVNSEATSAECYKVAVHAMVLPGIVMFVNWVLPGGIPMFLLVYLVLAGLYAYQFLKNLNKEEHELESLYE